MEREKIEQAAIELCTTEGQEEWVKDYGVSSFMDGARWRIAAAWHDTSERPKKGEQIVIQTKHGNFTSWFASDDIMDVFTKFETKRWAYAADLLPENGKQAEPWTRKALAPLRAVLKHLPDGPEASSGRPSPLTLKNS